MERIDIAIGHLRLDKLQAHHLEAFYKNLAEPGMNQHGSYAVSDKLNGLIQERKMTGEHIKPEKATAICAAIDLPVKAEQCSPPKVERKEARYLTDEQARRFLDVLNAEPDIRKKTSLILLLFTGLRRGELLGLEWQDIDIDRQVIHVRRASQVQKNVGVTEAPTKNVSSMRTIKISDYVIDLLTQYRVWWNERRLQYGTAWQGAQERLFIQDDGQPLYPDTINYRLSKFLEEHGFAHITPHSLRHTFCTLELAAGVD